MASLNFLNDDAVVVAPRLLGCWLAREWQGHLLVGRIIETEAYHEQDAASHSYKGRTPRVEVMFGPSGFAYVYFTYGMHYCLNVVAGRKGEGSAVLIRALEPIKGQTIMRQNRKGLDIAQVTNGPAKLCQAFAINKSFNGHDLTRKPLQLLPQMPVSPTDIVQATRIGISRDTHRLWRFYIRGNSFVSRP